MQDLGVWSSLPSFSKWKPVTMPGSFLQLGGLGLKELGLCGIQHVPKPFHPSLSPQGKPFFDGAKKGCGLRHLPASSLGPPAVPQTPRSSPHWPLQPLKCIPHQGWGGGSVNLRTLIAGLPVRIPPGPCRQSCGPHVGGAGAGRGLTRGRARPAAAAPAQQQRPQGRFVFLRRLALQSWGAVWSVDPALLPLPPETAPSFRTALRRRPPILLLHAAPWTTRLHRLPAAWAPCQGASWAGSEQQS